jgi:hypothetical protein
MKIKCLILLFISVLAADVTAQNSQGMYFMNLPQNHLLNPAFRPSSRLYIGLPVISGVNLSLNNNFINFSDVFLKGKQPSDSIISFIHDDFDVDRFLSRIKERSSVELQSVVQLLGVGFSAGKDLCFFMDINERAESNLVFPGDLIRLGFLGNADMAGMAIDLSSLRADLRYFHEVGFGASKNVTEKLRIGAKAKLFFGVAAGSIENNALKLTVNNDYTHTLNADMALNISGPLQFYVNDENKIDSVEFDNERFDNFNGIRKFLTNTTNPGFGFDIGAEYKITDRIIVSAAVTDFGFIKWKTDLTNLKVAGSYDFQGLSLQDVYDGTVTFEDFGKGIIDSLVNSFTITDNKEPFTTTLPFGVSVGGKYNLTDKFSFGVLSHSRILGKQVKQALILSANMNLSNIFLASLCYTASNHYYDNLGLGFAARAGVVQFYLFADRIPVIWNKVTTEGGSSFTLPARWNNLHTRFGINLIFGNRMLKE